MGGLGSGGRNRLSNEEKKRRGTYRSNTSEEVQTAAVAAKVVTGPWLERIPDPELPLGEVGRRKYDEICTTLLEANKLTHVTRLYAELAASQWEKIHSLKTAGKHPSASDVTQLNRSLDALKIAEDAPAITDPTKQKNRFASSGFANRPNSPFRLRRPAAASSGK